MLGCSYLASQDILVIHEILGKITAEEDRLNEIKKQKKAEEEQKKQNDSSPTTPSSPSSSSNPLAGMFGGLAGLGGLAGITSPQNSPKPEEAAAKAKEGMSTMNVNNNNR